MAWVKVDDQFPDHPKVVSAGPLAKALFVDSLCYANRLLTDGFVPERIANRLASEFEEYENAACIIERLISVGLWERVDGGYQIHQYLDYQPSAEKVKEERSANAKRQAEWRERQHNTVTDGVSNSVSNGTSNGTSNGLVTPAPSRPVPVPNPVLNPDENRPPVGKKTSPKPVANLEGFDDFYSAYPRKEDRKNAEGLWAKLTAEDRDLAVKRIREHLAAGMFSLERQFQPLPSTWLNKRRFLDPPVKSAMANGAIVNGQRNLSSVDLRRRALGENIDESA